MTDDVEKETVTEEQYQIFVTEVNRWIEIFGMEDWQIGFKQKELPNDRA